MRKSEIIVIIIIFNFFLLAFLSAIITYILQYKNKKKQYNKLLETKEIEHQKEILSTQIEIQNQTMQKLGREIHDNIGQKLTLASLYTQQLAFENKAPNITENIENISNIINQSLVELRELSKTLTNNFIDNNSIYELIKAECDKIDGLKTCTIVFDIEDENLDLSYQLKAILYRIIQEFTQNSMKHSQCKNISIVLIRNENEIDLTINDDGIGFNQAEQINNGIGLANMQKRIKILNGTYILNSIINKGTELKVKLPIIDEKKDSNS
jgi:signal transduction histidine kinase